MPARFREVRLGELAYFEMGQSPPSSCVSDDEIGPPFLQGNAEFGAAYPTAESYCSQPKKMCERGDILISVRAPVGDLNKTDRAYVIGRGLAAIRFTEISTGFGWHLLNYWASDLDKVAQGTTFKAVSKGDLSSLTILLPSAIEQQRIAETLDAADKAIRQSERVIAKLREVKKGLLHDLLTRGLDAGGKLRDPEAHAEQFRDSPLGRIPRNWEIVTLSEHAVVVGGKRLPSGHSYVAAPTGYRYLRVTDFYDRAIDYEALEHLAPETFQALLRWEIREGDLYLSIAGSIGYAGVFRPPIADRAILTENAARIVPGSCFVPEFLAMCLNGERVQAQIEAQKGTGGGVPKLALFRIRRLIVACPPLKEQHRLVTVLEAQDARIRSEETTLGKLRQVKRGLMDDLLTGRVRVGN